MRLFFRKFLLVLFACCFGGFCLGLPTCGASEEGFLRFSVPNAMTNLDPQGGTSSIAFTLGNHLWEGLVRLEGEKILPGIAYDWILSEENTRYRFFLRSSQWNDGTPLEAKDFVYAVRRLLDPERKSPYAFIAYGLKNARSYNRGEIRDFSLVGVKAPDSHTLECLLQNQDASFLSRLGLMPFFPVSEKFEKSLSEEPYAQNENTMLYNGPFRIERWIPGKEMLLRKNASYWNASAVHLPGVFAVVERDPERALERFEAGEFHFCDIPSSKYIAYVRRGKGELLLTGAVDWIRCNCRKRPETPWGSNVNFRRALGYALNREMYVENATQKLYFPQTRYVFPFLKGVHRFYREEYPLVFYSPRGDPEKARSYLRKALEEMGMNSPREITVSFLIQDGGECRLLAEELKRQVESVLGICFTPVFVTRKERECREYSGNFDLVYGGWMPDYNDPMTYLEIWESAQSKNSGAYSNPEYDALLEAARNEGDMQKRMDFLFQAEKLLLEDAPLIPLQLRRKAWICDPRVHNLVHSFVGGKLSFVNVWIEP